MKPEMSTLTVYGIFAKIILDKVKNLFRKK